MVLVGKFTQQEVKRSLLRVGKKLKWIVPRSQWVEIDSEGCLVLMAERLERTSMSVLKCASSPYLNLLRPTQTPWLTRFLVLGKSCVN